MLSLTLAALLLRLTGLSFLQPHSWEPDGLVLERQVEHIERSTPNPERDVFYGYYPHLIARLVSLTPPLPSARDDTLEEHLRAASSERVRIRRTIAALSALIVPGTWMLARFFLARGPALFAAGLAAFGLLQIWFAQQARPHALSSVFALFAVIGAVRLRRRPTLVGYAAAFLMAMLAVCSLQSGFAVLLPLCAAHALRAEAGTRRANLAFLAGLLVIAAALPIYYPFAFAPSESGDAAALGLDGSDVKLSGHTLVLSAFDGRGFATVLGAMWNYEPIVTLLLAAGLVVWILERRAQRQREREAAVSPAHAAWSRWRARVAGREDLAVVLAFVVPYFLVIGTYALTFPRFAIPLLPFAFCGAAFGLYALATRARAGDARVAHGLALAIVLLQACVAFRLVTIRAADDTARRAAQWIAAHVDPARDRLVHSAGIDLPLVRTHDALLDAPRTFDSLFPWIRYQREFAPSRLPEPGWDLRPFRTRSPDAREHIARDALDFLRSTGAQYAVVDVYVDAALSHSAPIVAALRSGPERLARFSPLAVDTGDDWPMPFQDDEFESRPNWWWRTIRARSMGPVIEIYRLDERR